MVLNVDRTKRLSNLGTIVTLYVYVRNLSSLYSTYRFYLRRLRGPKTEILVEGTTANL